MGFSDAQVRSVTRISPDCTQYVLGLESGTFDGQAGQHTALRTPAGVKPYSTLVVDGNRIVLMIRAYGTEGVADYMADRAVGDLVQVKTDLTGNLTLRGTTRPAVFVGTGTGITPLLGLLHAYVTGSGPKAVVMFGEKTQDQLLYKAMLEQYELVHPVELRLSLSREDWHGHSGYIQEQLPGVVSDIGPDADYYLCGVPAAVVAGKNELDRLGVSPDDVHTEGWEDARVAA